MSTVTTAVATLYSQIENGLVPSGFSNKPFVPEDKLMGPKGLLASPVIEEEIHKKTSYTADSNLVGYIEKHAKRVFAILVYSNLVKKALTLKDCKFMDRYLPVQVDGNKVTTFHLLADDKALSWFAGWDEHELGFFKMLQWHFIAPVFTQRSILEQPHDLCPLPFTSYDNTPDGGSFGKIHKAYIHSDHIKGFQLDEKSTVAIKELRATNISDRAYEVEMDALELARWLEDEHLVKFIAGFEVAGKHYLMFQWVDGGNLRSFWENSPWSRDEDLICWALEQMKGISKGLERLHNFDLQRNCRHGDLKPENILVSQRLDGVKVLQIADMGSAKIHSAPTSLRQIGTMSLAGTLRYQPPEVQTSISGKRSRAYDIWSIGCILLELIIWVLHGPDGLSEFNESFDNITQPFFHVEQESGPLQPNVDEWIKHLQETCLGTSDEECVSQALRDLLDFVRTQILVENDAAENDAELTNTGPQNTSSRGIPQFLVTRATTRVTQGAQQRRADISDVKAKLEQICSNTETNYFYNEQAAIKETSKGVLKSEELKSRLMLRPNQTIRRAGRPQQQIADPENPYSVLPLSDTWELCNDNIFARDVFRILTSTLMREDFPEIPEAQISQLCQNCGKIFLNEFSFTLATSKPSCYLCQVLSPYLQSYAQTLDEGARNSVKLVRVGSSLATSSTAAPMLSIVVGPGYSNVPSHIQRGFPNLAKSPSTTQALLFRHWLDDCDKKHGETCKVSDTQTRRPTRLINVSLNSLKLECSPGDCPYVALSHPWGDPERHARFCTTKSNKESLEESIDYDKLPKNFQDAVAVTRSLGIKYLWIDSLCIIQKEKGDKGDFHIESRFMEDYYSGAYCTLAASSADGSSSGFLARRPTEYTTRRCHGLQSSSGPESAFYICNSIDDFARDVETSHLSTRGWVFQERALSRRTIHFAGTQAYWECGHGVRCETMSRLFNRRSSFLSDPNFPSSATQYYKGMRIEFFQYIYSRYSTLEFSQETDRSVAMFGLERRLARVYGVRARYGILDKTYLHRSLLWQIEDKSKPLRKIDFGNDTKVPSWSWMAVMGPIKYMDAPFDLMKWNYDIKSPFGDPFTDKNGVWTQPVSDFRVPARDVLQEVDPGRLIYDRPEDNDAISVRDKLKCVIIGYEKMESDEDPSDWYTLLVSPTSDGLEDDYERIGVARMTADDIDLEKHTMVRIV